MCMYFNHHIFPSITVSKVELAARISVPRIESYSCVYYNMCMTVLAFGSISIILLRYILINALCRINLCVMDT